MSHMLLDPKELQAMRKTLRKELAELQKELDQASFEHREVAAWKSELAALAASPSPESDRMRLDQDLLDVTTYYDELRRLVKHLEKAYRDVFSLDRHYQSQQRRAQELTRSKVAAQTSNTSKGPGHQRPPSLPRTSPPARKPEYVRQCISCRSAPASLTGSRTARLYCPQCRPAPVSAFFAALKQRRKELDFSISSRWPSQFTGLGMQGGAPGLGKRA